MQYSPEDSAPEGEEPEYEGFDHERYKSMWREWVDVYADARRQSFRDEEYYDGDVKGTGEGHWTKDELGTLADRKQPPSVFNLIKRKVNAIAGVEQRSRAEPRALPRTPKDQYAAEIATDALRYVKEQTRLSMTSANGFLEALKVGYTASEIEGAEDHVIEKPIEWRDFAFDPLSRMFDFSDARWLAIAKWVDADVAKETYAPAPPKPKFPPPPKTQDPGQLMQWLAVAEQIKAEYEREVERADRIRAIIEGTASGQGSGSINIEDYEDHPGTVFCDHKRKRIFVVDMWHREPQHGWYRCVFTGMGKLFTEAAHLVEKDQWGKPQKTHPIKAFSLYVSKDGWRYGEVRGMRSPQDEVNMRRSKALHLLTVNQIINRTGNHSATEEGGREALRREASRPDGYLDVPDPTLLRIEKNLDLAAGQQKLGEEARAFMEMEGPNPQLQGEQGRATSGRAVLALQQAGLGQLGPIFDRFHDWEDRRYKAMWFRVQQFWTGPMYVRVTDDKNAAKFAAVNGAPMLDEQGQPKRKPPPQAPMMGAQPIRGPMPNMGGGAMARPGMMMQPGGSDMALQQMGAGGQPPMLGHNGGPAIDPNEFETGPMLAELDMDIIIDRAPEAATLQAEQFEELSKLAQAGVLGPPSPETARMIITASALPTKSQLLDMLDKAAQAPKQPDQGQMAELKKLMAQIEEIVAKTQKTKAETAKIGAEIPKTQAETEHAAAQARTENVTATMNEFEAGNALKAFGALSQLPPGGSPAPLDPLVASAPQGAIGLPPTQG